MAPAAQDQNYHIGALDLLDISVFQVDSLTRTVQVDGDGEVDLPFIGHLAAAGRTPSQLSDEIATAYSREGYLESPQVSVFVKESVRLRYTVGGSVKTPGNFPLVGHMTLLQGIAGAGGMDYEARANKVVIFRMVDDRRTTTVVDLGAIQAGKGVDPPIRAGDVIMVPESATKRAIKDLVSVTPLIFLATIFR